MPYGNLDLKHRINVQNSLSLHDKRGKGFIIVGTKMKRPKTADQHNQVVGRKTLIFCLTDNQCLAVLDYIHQQGFQFFYQFVCLHVI